MKFELQTSYYGDEREERVSQKVFIWLAGIFSAIFIFFFVVDVAMLQKYRFILVSGWSMQNTLNPNATYGSGQDGVYILLTKDVTYGDIIVREESKDKSIIKRVMALGGDKICLARVKIADSEEEQIRFMRIKKGTTNLEILEEDYIKNYETDGYTKWDEKESVSDINGVRYSYDFYHESIEKNRGEVTTEIINGKEYLFLTIAEDEFFYMGDNRLSSEDCRQEGPKSIDKIVGKVVKVSRNIYSFENSPFFLFNYAGDYLSLIWDEIVSYFSF